MTCVTRDRQRADRRGDRADRRRRAGGRTGATCPTAAAPAPASRAGPGAGASRLATCSTAGRGAARPECPRERHGRADLRRDRAAGAATVMQRHRRPSRRPRAVSERAARGHAGRDRRRPVAHLALPGGAALRPPSRNCADRRSSPVADHARPLHSRPGRQRRNERRSTARRQAARYGDIGARLAAAAARARSRAHPFGQVRQLPRAAGGSTLAAPAWSDATGWWCSA